jgi:hypothetical protein
MVVASGTPANAVGELLHAAGLPADPQEVMELAAGYQELRRAVDGLWLEETAMAIPGYAFQAGVVPE